MEQKHRLSNILQKLSQDLRAFIDLSMQESDESWERWSSSVIRDIEVRCWEKKKCEKLNCPKYRKAEGRCWLIVGTLCGEEVQGKFALKYKNCTECDVYKEAVYSDPVSETYEHLFTLVHSVRTKELELKALAIRDALTGLHNRHYFEIVMARETGKINRHGGKLSIVIIDINKFKMINDTYGHLHGDGILKECSAILSRAVRSSDILVRFGGDEFIIAMPETDCSERGPLIARINNHLAAWNDKFASNGYLLSFSIGCAMFEKGKDLRDVIQEADARMYEHKAQCSSDAP